MSQHYFPHDDQHSFPHGEYGTADDQEKREVALEEVTRLTGQHKTWTYASGGRVLWAPVNLETPLRVLDSAGADGLWLRTFASMQPQAFRSRSFYVSADIDPFKFPSVAGARGSDWPDIQYMQHSILDAWPEDLHETFDLVHQRLVMAASGSVPFVETLMRFKSILRPGGWLQLVEWDTSPSPEQVGSAMEDHKDLVRAVGARTGVPPNFAAKLKDDLGEAGFVDVKEDHFTVLHGKRILERGGPTDIAELSIESPVMFNRRFCSIAKKSGAEIEDQKLERLSERLEEELRNVGGSILVRVVCGCRP